MKNIHPEFAYQSRELGAQIEDTLGDPPDKKGYAKIIKSLIVEYANGAEFGDVNLLSFALADYLRFDDPAGLLAQCAQYDMGDAAKVLTMVSCADADAGKALLAVGNNNPDLARQAILTAFLYKNKKRWTVEEETDEDQQEEKGDADEDDEDHLTPGHDFEQLFDSRGDKND